MYLSPNIYCFFYVGTFLKGNQLTFGFLIAANNHGLYLVWLKKHFVDEGLAW